MADQRVDASLAKKAAFLYAKVRWGNVAVGNETRVLGIHDDEVRAYVFAVGKHPVEPDDSQMNAFVSSRVVEFVDARRTLRTVLAQHQPGVPKSLAALRTAKAQFEQGRLSLLDGDRIGTVVIRASKTGNPLVMTYDGIPCTITGVAIARAEKQKGYSPDAPPVFRMPDGSGYPHLYADLVRTDGTRALVSLFNVDHQFSPPKYERPPRIEAPEIQKEHEGLWEALGRVSTNPDPLRAVYSFPFTITDVLKFNVANVPNLAWHKGCAPTAAGMVLAYWDPRGYPKLVDDEVSKNAYDLIAQLADAMGTDSGGSTKDKYTDDGIRAVCNDAKYKNQYRFTVSDGDEENVWGLLVSELKAHRPSHLILHGHEKYGDHSVALIGCRQAILTIPGIPFAFNVYFVTIHDTWDTTKDVEIPYGGSVSGSDSDWILIRVWPGTTRSSAICMASNVVQRIAKQDQRVLFQTLADEARGPLREGVHEIYHNPNLSDEFNRLLNSANADLEVFGREMMSAAQLCMAMRKTQTKNEKDTFSEQSASVLARLFDSLKKSASPQLAARLDAVIQGIREISGLDVAALRKHLLSQDR